jgi:hypothetical protein
LQSHCAPALVPSAHCSVLRGNSPVQSLGDPHEPAAVVEPPPPDDTPPALSQ